MILSKNKFQIVKMPSFSSWAKHNLFISMFQLYLLREERLYY